MRQDIKNTNILTNRHYQPKLHETHFKTRHIDSNSLEEAYKLRYQVFSEQLSWLSKNKKKLETDRYDNYSEHFGIFDSQHLLVYLRLITNKHDFMIENEFIDLVDKSYKIKKSNDTGEISRLCISQYSKNYPLIHTNYGNYSITMLLYKYVYHWCNKNNIRYLYFVIEQKIYRLISAKGFPCDPIGTPKIMSDGVVAMAVILDWKKFEKINISKRPRMFRWFSQDQSIQTGSPSLQPELYLPHQAYL